MDIFKLKIKSGKSGLLKKSSFEIVEKRILASHQLKNPLLMEIISRFVCFIINY